MEYGLNCTCDTFFYISRFPLPAHLDLHGCGSLDLVNVEVLQVVSLTPRKGIQYSRGK